MKATNDQSPTLAAERNHDLDDAAGRQPSPKSVGCGPDEPSAMAGLDRRHRHMGHAADEPGTVGRVRPEPHEVDSFARSVWGAFAQLFVTYDEALQAIECYRAGGLRNMAIRPGEA